MKEWKFWITMVLCWILIFMYQAQTKEFAKVIKINKYLVSELLKVRECVVSEGQGYVKVVSPHAIYIPR